MRNVFTASHRTTGRLVLLASLLTSFGCDSLTVNAFNGTVIVMSLHGASVTPPGQHLELWARDQYDDIIRINPYYDEANNKTHFGLMIRQAIAPDDPCVIDDQGNLLTTAAAYPGPVTVAGVTQTPEEQAEQVRERIAQLNPPTLPPLLAVLPTESTPPPSVPANAAPADRKDACDRYRAASEITYIPNPAQITAPLHGAVFGFVFFTSQDPPINYDGFRLDTPVNLRGVQELFITVEGNNVDPNNRGRLFLVSTETPGGIGVKQYNLKSPTGSGVSGSAALYTHLDQDSNPY